MMSRPDFDNTIRAFLGADTTQQSRLFDSSDNATHGTMTGAVSQQADVTFNRNYATFGASAYSDLGATSLIPQTSAWTLTAWVRKSTWGAENVIFSQYIASASGGPGRILFRAFSGVPELFLGSTASHPSVQVSGGEFTDGDLHHYAARRNGAVFTLFIDGSQVASRTDSAATREILQTGCLVAARTGSSTSYNGAPIEANLAGDMADLSIWNTALSDAEISWLADEQNSLLYQADGATRQWWEAPAWAV